jgi:hypothetical protein
MRRKSFSLKGTTLVCCRIGNYGLFAAIAAKFSSIGGPILEKKSFDHQIQTVTIPMTAFAKILDQLLC